LNLSSALCSSNQAGESSIYLSSALAYDPSRNTQQLQTHALTIIDIKGQQGILLIILHFDLSLGHQRPANRQFKERISLWLLYLVLQAAIYYYRSTFLSMI